MDIDVSDSNSNSSSSSLDGNIEPPPFFHLDDQLDDMDRWLGDFLAQDRRPKQRCKWMDFQKHIQLQSNANMFQRHHHMTPKSFAKLVSTLKPHLQVNKGKAASAGGHTPAEHAAAMGLWHLGGMVVKRSL